MGEAAALPSPRCLTFRGSLGLWTHSQAGAARPGSWRSTPSWPPCGRRPGVRLGLAVLLYTHGQLRCPFSSPQTCWNAPRTFPQSRREPSSNQKGRWLPFPPPALIQLNKRLTITYSAPGPVLSDGIGLRTEGFSDDGECTQAGRSCQGCRLPLGLSPLPPGSLPAHLCRVGLV